MIVFDPFWKTLKEKNMSVETLITKYNISENTINRLRENKEVSTLLLNRLCNILHCNVQDIFEYVPEK